MAAFNNKWLDPAKFETLEQFTKAYNESFARAQAYKEIYALFESAEKMIENLRKQIEKPEKNYEI